MKTTLLNLLAFILFQFSIAETHEITWGVPYHGTTEILVGDTVRWNFVGFHDVTSSGSPSFPSSATQTGGFYEVTFNTVGDYYFFCSVHGAASMDGTISVSEVMSVNDLLTKNNFYIHPNPANTTLNLLLPDNIKNCTIEVYDVLGKNIFKSSGTKPRSIDVRNWKSGLYFVKIATINKSITKRFIKQ